MTRKAAADRALSPDSRPHHLGPYPEFLSARLASSTGMKRSQRTKLTLMIGAARALNQQGLRLATVGSIVDAAGLSHSTFYLHFASKNAAASAVLLAFIDDMEVTGKNAPKPVDDYERAYLATLHYVSAFRANPGIARALLQLDDDQDPELNEVRARLGSAWYSKSTQVFLKHFPKSRLKEPQLRLAITVMGGMVDDFLRRWVVHRHEDVVALVKKVAPKEEDLAEALTCLWWRALVGVPPRAQSAFARALLEGATAPVDGAVIPLRLPFRTGAPSNLRRGATRP